MTVSECLTKVNNVEIHTFKPQNISEYISGRPITNDLPTQNDGVSVCDHTVNTLNLMLFNLTTYQDHEVASDKNKTLPGD